MKITAATAAGQLIFLLISPFLTRLYSPGDFGLFTVLTSFIAILSVLATLRLELAVPLAKSDREARRIALVSVSAALLVCVAASLLLIDQRVALLIVAEGQARWFWIVPVSAFFFATYEVISQYSVRHKRYGLLGTRSFVQSVGMSGGQLGLGIVSFSPGLLFGQLLGKAAAIGYMVPRTKILRPRTLGCTSFAAIGETLKRQRRFPLYLMPAALLNTMGTQLPYVLVALLFGAPVVGLLGLTQRVLAAPASLLGQAISNVFMGESANALRTGGGSNYRQFMNTSLALAVIGIPFFTLLMLLAPQLFGLVFGAEWNRSGYFAQAMTLSFLLQFVVVPISQTLIINGAQLTQLIWDAGRLAVVAGAILVAYFLGVDDLTAVWAYSVASAGSYVILWFLCFRVVRTAHTRAG